VQVSALKGQPAKISVIHNRQAAPQGRNAEGPAARGATPDLLSFFIFMDSIYREFSKGLCMDDRSVISRIKQGDMNGLEFLVNRYQVRAVHAAYLILYDRALAEDIAQTAFVRVAERINQFDEERAFAPWFFRIVVNEALKLARKQKRAVSLQELDEPAAQIAEWLIDPDFRPEQLLEQKEIRENILHVIQSLPPEQRAVIVMRYFLDMSDADMSRKMDRPLSTIKWWLREARKRLRNLIRSSQGFEDGK
jgi:RNA polymerase sigma-70 factor (ECF subfamily)